jgi:hypothetical protein
MVNVLIAGLITIAGGILAASGVIIAKKPNAKELIDKLVPYQGWIGIVMFGWGIWEVLDTIHGLTWMSHFLFRWIFLAASTVADIGVGFLLGFGLITKYALSKNEQAMAKGQELRAKLVGVQVPLGFLAIGTGIGYILFNIL